MNLKVAMVNAEGLIQDGGKLRCAWGPRVDRNLLELDIWNAQDIKRVQ